MTMPDQETLDALSCAIDRRPAGAPTFEDLAPALRAVERRGGTLAVTYDDSIAAMVEAVAAAERECCAGIDFRVEHAPSLRLVITATPEQAAIFEDLFRGGEPA